MRVRQRLILGVLLAVAFAGHVVAAAAPAQPSTAPSEAPDDTLRILCTSGGTLSSAVRQSYLDWARGIVLARLTSDAVPADVDRELAADPTLADAMFASVYPPDAVLELRSDTRRGAAAAPPSPARCSRGACQPIDGCAA